MKSLALVSLITLTCLYGLLAALIILVCIIADASVMTGILLSIAGVIVQFLISPWLTDLSMRFFYKAKFDAELPEWLTDFVKEVCDKHGAKMPRIGYINDGAPNAFTYGRTKNDARIVITRGTLELLDEEEAKAVVAHELGHVMHYDMLIMTVAQIVPLVMYAIYEACTEAAEDTSKSKSKDDSEASGGLMLIGLVAYVLYIICQLIILWLSRTREYFADSFSVDETGNPSALAGALVKIGYGLSTAARSEASSGHSAVSPTTLGISDAKSSKAMAVCCVSDGSRDPKQSIRNAMKWDMWNVWAKLYELGSTHPLISKRLLAISARCEEFGQTPYITFDEKKPESYVDDFARECAISFAPSAALLTGIIFGYVFPVHPEIMIYGFILCMVLSLLKFRYRYPQNMCPSTVEELLGEVKVSGITCIPVEIEGEIIGRGNPGCIFNEDFVLKDKTGIVMLDYDQPLRIVNRIFALFKSEKYFGKITKVTGWYRRSPVPYIEVKTMETDGVLKKCRTWQFGYVLRWILLAAGVLLLLLELFGSVL